MFHTRTGTRLIDRNVRRVLDAAVEDAGLSGFSFHTFRHTCASMLFESGKNIAQVSKWLGHADPAFTLRTYVHLLDGGLGDAVHFDETFGGNAGATQHPKTDATPTPRPVHDDALQSETVEQPQAPVSAAGSS